jgi:hypothetical protein
MADINRELERETEDIIKRHEETIKKETGIESSISDVDSRNYVKEVIAVLYEKAETENRLLGNNSHWSCLDKDPTRYDDIFGSFRLALQFYY